MITGKCKICGVYSHNGLEAHGFVNNESCPNDEKEYWRGKYYTLKQEINNLRKIRIRFKRLNNIF